MQRTVARISALFMMITAAAACALHFFLLRSENKQDCYSYSIYILICVGAVFAAIYAFVKKDTAPVIDFENGNQRMKIASSALAATFFYDFIHQGYNLYYYIVNTDYVRYSFVIPLVIICITAILSCFYFITVAMTADHASYDFRSFTYLHFSPMLWALVKLFIIMMQIVDITDNSEVCCEYIFLSAALCYTLSFILAVDRGNGKATKMFIFSSCTMGITSVVAGVPRIIMFAIGKGGELERLWFSAIHFVMFGIFALTLLYDVTKRSKEKG